jgi:hypothetical protein
MNRLKQSLSIVLACSIVLASVPDAFADPAGQSTVPPEQQNPEQAHQTPEQLQRLVAPIALYPDELVGQILAAATYPDQIVEADRWVQAHPELKGQQLGQDVDAQSWDDSVKGLTEFPSVLANMDKNLSWTSSLGDAYINQEQDVMKAVQALRQRAEKAGNLQTTSQQKVTQQGKTIVIQPADTQIVYVPQYDPWLAYGSPFDPWPGWYGYPGLYFDGPGLAFGLGFGIGFFGGFGWGFGHWGADWHNHNVMFNHNRFVSHSRAFANRGNFGGRANGMSNRGGAFHNRGSGVSHAGGSAAPHDRGSFGGGHMSTPHSTFGGFNHGGVSRGFSGRGRSSFGGGGFHGGGFGGGGARGGGGGRR